MEWKCNPDCKGGCCGVVPVSHQFIAVHRNKIQVKIERYLEFEGGLVFPVTDDRKCVFLNRETFLCEVYSERPKICRMFGQSPELLCAYIKMDGTPRKLHEMKYVARKMDAMFDKRLAKVME